MNTTQNRGAAFRTKQTARIGITSAALLAIVGGGVLTSAAAANAAPGGPAIQPQAEITNNIGDVIKNVKVEAIENAPANPDVDLSWRSALITSFDLHVPNDAQPGDTIGIRVGDGQFRFLAFSGVEIKTAAGELIGTASRSADDQRMMYIKLGDAVATSENIVGKVTVSAQPLQHRDQTTGTFSLFSNDGAVNLGPNTEYVISATSPASTNTILAPATFGNEVGFNTLTHSTGGVPADLSQVTMTIKPIEGQKGLVPDCEKSQVNWLSDGSYVQTDAGFKPRIISCNLATGEVTLGFPAGAVAPADIDGKALTGFTFRTFWVADKPQTEYSLTSSTIRGTGATPQVTTGKGTSPAIDGVGEGQVRQAATSITKTSNAPERLIVGAKFDYEIISSNDEELRPAYAIQDFDKLPEGVEFVSATAGGKYDAKTRTVTWPAVDIEGAGERKLGVTVKVLDSAADVITNTAWHIGTNTPKAEASVSDTLTRLGLELEKKLLEVVDANNDGTIGNAGDVNKYGFDVTNTGTAPEKVITLNDKLLGIDGQEIILDTALEPGATIQLPGEYAYTITAEDEKAGKVVNEASVSVPGMPTPVTDTIETETSTGPGPTPAPTPAASSTPAPAATVDLAKTGADAFGIWAAVLGGITLLGGGAVALLRRNRTASPAESTPSE
ncbi:MULTISPECIES: DUF7507 domain-containing protein [unclassified Pseudoclavibacter]|uniref:DUF7507 domain-containing protein n=1 Tax=unclassified Pseudoclavibacter TaxID=2615177 RepID=UPI001BA723B3|nr:LPXTG cell wall anchor domain-containing protein [Pseudoclavibacter sp. Marseille-Q4354]MBS3177247.1 LPXTG cell wall anchor domain-containing protein [Pseudoclavibacter sp. Marseille-Q4354]